MRKILVIDDEKEIVELIKKGFEEEKYDVLTAFNGRDGLKILENNEISLVILDIMMPGINGMEVCNRIRSFSNLPIIMVSVKSQEQDKISGLLKGADDYMTKPFSVAELIARATSQIRRFTYLNDERTDRQQIKVKGLSINEQNHTVTLFGKSVKLTPTEFSILLLLSKNKGIVFSSEEIYKRVWPDEKYYEGNNTVMSHMWRLREKIEVNPKEAKIIETVWGVGYKIEDEEY
ncbi:response regulator transcription factor [Anaerosacchariphilus polymeriproducens]|uniref:Stage 0 sporulation protein A homolog n=1 Tax=Anaerosacchariphilus polymeriproducens TaxID=1812858 RepID=A0A371B087_9FIRM|nr:response regulator transcription factor [Anaerosacchariphilus polymeriproducens]RDU25203.1 DNA-binding response regulator [Anaerosacchariphilus polymeriproducens]